jgi:hypothetical protein
MHRFVSPKRVQRTSILFEKYGGFATIFSRFVLGTRNALLPLKRERPERIIKVTPAPTCDSEPPSKPPTRNLSDKKKRKIINCVLI